MEWQPIETIPRDGQKVLLKNKDGLTDAGEWYSFDGHALDWWKPEVGDDYTGGLSTELGLGDYTHWLPLAKQTP